MAGDKWTHVFTQSEHNTEQLKKKNLFKPFSKTLGQKVKLDQLISIVRKKKHTSTPEKTVH